MSVEKCCLNCKWFALSSQKRAFGDCAHSGLKLPLERKQHKHNGKNCPHFEERKDQRINELKERE